MGAVSGPTCAGSVVQPRCLASHVGGEVQGRRGVRRNRCRLWAAGVPTPEVKAWFDQPDSVLLAQWKHHPELKETLGNSWRSFGVTSESSVLTLLQASRLLFDP